MPGWTPPFCRKMIEESAAPLKAVETDFAVDSSGFSTCTFVRWFDEKHGKKRTGRTWVKAHVMTGVKTNVISSVAVTNGDANDCPYLPPLVRRTAERFDIAEVSADKGYVSNMNFGVVEEIGAVPFISLQVAQQIAGIGNLDEDVALLPLQAGRVSGGTIRHKRSNVESTFSMLKRKFGAAVWSKTPVAQTNEILCKVLCHNLSVLVHSIYELGIEPTFWN